MNFLIFTFVALFVSLVSHAFLYFGFGVDVEIFSVIWWVITVVSGVIGWFASEELV